MTYYLTVDVGGLAMHVFAIDDATRAASAFDSLHEAITVVSVPMPNMVIVPLNEGEWASFRRTDLRAVSLVKSAS